MLGGAIERRLDTAAEDPACDWLGPAVQPACAVAAVVLLVGGAIAVWRNATAAPDEQSQIAAHAAAADTVLAALHRDPQLFTAGERAPLCAGELTPLAVVDAADPKFDGRLLLQWGVVEPPQYPVPAGVGVLHVQHPALLPRDYARTLTRLAVTTPQGTLATVDALWPAEACPPGGAKICLLGRLRSQGVRQAFVEGIAWRELPSGPDSASGASIHWATEQPLHTEILRGFLFDSDVPSGGAPR